MLPPRVGDGEQGQPTAQTRRLRIFFQLQVGVVDSTLRIHVEGNLPLVHDASYFDAITSCYSKTGTYGPDAGVQAIEYDEVENSTGPR